MFFRLKRSPTGQVLQLLEAFRPRGGSPRQRVVISLGHAAIPQAEQPAIAQAIHNHYYRFAQPELMPSSLSTAAQPWVDQIIKRIDRQARWKPWVQPESATDGDGETLDGVLIDQVTHTQSAELGPALVGWRIWQKLGLPEYLAQLGFNEVQSQAAAAAVINRLVDPVSENALGEWLERSALLDLWPQAKDLGSRDRFYRVSDKLLEHRNDLEKHLRKRQGQLLNLDRTILLYDLTNSYFEGEALGNPKAQRGKSKEKRNDRPQIVVGIIFDGEGFELAHQVFAGNQSDAKSLVEMAQALQELLEPGDLLSGGQKPLVIMDAGVATRANLRWLRRQDFNYLVNDSRRGRKLYRAEFLEKEKFAVLAGREHKPEVRVRCLADPHPWKPEDEEKEAQTSPPKTEAEAEAEAAWIEQIILCWSEGRQRKEQAIRSRVEENYRRALAKLDERVQKGKLKEPAKIQRAIGRLQQKHVRVQRFYQVQVQEIHPPAEPEGKKDPKVPKLKIQWNRVEDKSEADEELLGSYVLRTDRQDVTASSFWGLYMKLTQAEEGFKMLKSDLGLRPNPHQKEDRVEAHVFITVLAYHLLRHVLYLLESKKDSRQWETIKRILQTHDYTTILLPTKGGQVMRVRRAGLPEECQKHIYEILGIEWKSLPVTKQKVKMMDK